MLWLDMRQRVNKFCLNRCLRNNLKHDMMIDNKHVNAEYVLYLYIHVRKLNIIKMFHP